MALVKIYCCIVPIKSSKYICDVPSGKRDFQKRLTSKFRYILYLNFDVKRFEKYSFSYGTSHFCSFPVKHHIKIFKTFSKCWSKIKLTIYLRKFIGNGVLNNYDWLSETFSGRRSHPGTYFASIVLLEVHFPINSRQLYF